LQWSNECFCGNGYGRYGRLEETIVAIHRAMAIVMRCVVVLWLILCTLYANAHVPHLEIIIIKFGGYSIFYLYKRTAAIMLNHSLNNIFHSS